MLKTFNFGLNLTALFQILLQNDDLSIKHIEYLIRFSKQVRPKVFSVAAKCTTYDVGERLLRFCQEETSLLQEIIILLSYSEERIAGFIRCRKKDEQFCCHLLDSDQLKNSYKLMTKLTALSRTQYILKSKQTERAVLLLKSGEIIPDMINLSTLTKSIFHSSELLSILLDKKVNPCGLTGSETPIQQLAQGCQKQVDRKNKEVYVMLVNSIALLLEAGANVEDLNAYFGISESTTPLHVATEMALISGNVLNCS